MPSSNVVWGIYLKHKGFKRYVIPDSRDNGYSGHGNDEVIDRLTAMMRSARTEEERENYRKMIEQLSR